MADIPTDKVAKQPQDNGTPPPKDGGEAAAKPDQAGGKALQDEAVKATYTIDGKPVDLKGGFNRPGEPLNTPRHDFPTPNLSEHLVPKGSPNASTGGRPESAKNWVERKAGEDIGKVLGWDIAFKSKLFGRETDPKFWEHYGQDRSELGKALDLAHDVDRRNQLENKNLSPAYPEGARTGNVPVGLVPPRSAEVSRTVDGTGNDLGDPAMGAAGTRFQYNTKPDTRYAINDPPIEAAADLLVRKDFKELPVLNLLGAFNLQANVHDWMDHGKHQNTSPTDFYTIELPPDHPIRQPHPLGQPWMGLDVSYKLTSGDKLDITMREQTLTTPDGQKVVAKADGSFEMNGKAIAATEDSNGKMVKLPDGTVIHQQNGMITGLERNGQEGKLPGQTEMKVPKLLVDSDRTAADGTIRQTYQNTVTHWWDASEIYGSDQKTADRLRSHENGKMRLDKDGLLPMGPEGVPDTGFNQNWSAPLEVIHTLYVREHNSICDMLIKDYPKDQYPQWKDKLPEIVHGLWGDPAPKTLTDAQYDEFVYSRARLINAAEIAKIHTVDWTPIALNNKSMTEAMYHNYGQEKLPPLAQKLDQHEVGGIWGHHTEQNGVPYAMEEDFVQSYQQMHPLVPDNLKLYDLKTGKQTADIPMDHALQGDAHTVIKAAGFDNVLYSMEKGLAGQITAGNHPNFMRDLNVRGNYVDLAAVDILRGREKQLPRYNEYLREMHEKPVANFEELIPNNTELREKIRKVYGNDIEKVDTVIGSLSEWPDRTPKTMGFSASTFLEFILMASRRVQADRFYTADFRPGIYTPEGIDRVRGLNGMKDVIERNAPALKDAPGQRDSAFHPLGDGPIPLNSSGIDELPVNDIQAHLAAFDPTHKGEVNVKDLEYGFEAIGYDKFHAHAKAALAEAHFKNAAAAVGLDTLVISDIKPSAYGMYDAKTGNLDMKKVDGLFNGKQAITKTDVNSYLKTLKTYGVPFATRTFISGQFDSGFQSVHKNSITRDEFVRIMNGDIMKQAIAAKRAAEAAAQGDKK